MSRFVSSAVILALALCASTVHGVDLKANPPIHALIDDLVAKHQFDRNELETIFMRVQLRPKVVRAMKRPAERLPWHQYKRRFVTTEHVDFGVQFWRQHQVALEQAEQRYGIPKSIIVAILGVETRYGRNTGVFPVIDSLTTLTLQYPRRSKFFRSELEQFLLLAREEGWDPVAIKGSYAGAMGVPQFIASSYRAYAVDFSGDKKRDLINEPIDAIGSVASYLERHRWRRDAPIVDGVAMREGAKPEQHVTKKLRPNTTVAELTQSGVRPAAFSGIDGKVGLVRLENGEGYSYRIAFNNFYVITRYNYSINYAMAVYELSQALKRRYHAG